MVPIEKYSFYTFWDIDGKQYTVKEKWKMFNDTSLGGLIITMLGLRLKISLYVDYSSLYFLE